MKAPAFDYVRPHSLPDALALLREHGERAKIIAGGQSLVPALNLRLLAPAIIVDIGALNELRGITISNDIVRIGALTRHVDLQRSAGIAQHVPLVAQAIARVAHPAVRNRGTIGGSLAQADPATELPACAIALEAMIVVTGVEGERSVPARDFFRGLYETALAPDEILVRVDVPTIGEDQRPVFFEFARRAGDYAIVGLAGQATLGDGGLRELRLAYFGVGGKPTLVERAAACLVGRRVDQAALTEAEAALGADLEAQDDLQASAATRLHLARVLLRRAVGELLPGAALNRRSA